MAGLSYGLGRESIFSIFFLLFPNIVRDNSHLFSPRAGSTTILSRMVLGDWMDEDIIHLPVLGVLLSQRGNQRSP